MHRAHTYVKTLLDGVFGKASFRNEIVWAYTGPSNTTRWFPRKHDTILFYVRLHHFLGLYSPVRVAQLPRGGERRETLLFPGGKCSVPFPLTRAPPHP